MAVQRLNRAERRARVRALTAYVLDGPKPEPVCGQAKAAARRRAREAEARPVTAEDQE